MPCHLLLAGSGHAHLELLSNLRDYTRRACLVTLVSPDIFWYSGMGPGIVSGTYLSKEQQVDTAKLVTQSGGTFIRDTVRRIDAVARTVNLKSGRTIHYNLLSVNVGSDVPTSRIKGADIFGWRVKPIAHLTRLRDAIREHAGTGGKPHIVVAGGGAAGCEVAINVWHLLHQLGAGQQIRIVTSGAALLESEGRRAGVEAAREMERLGIEVLFHRKVKQVTARAVHLDDKTAFRCDFLILATGVRPSSLFQDSGLPTASDGSLLVNAHLQSVAAPEIFGAGDCVGFASRPPPRVGVYAVREGKVLHHNLQATLDGRRLRSFRPPKHYLLILNLGDQRGLLLWRNHACRAHWAFRLKNFLDRGFVEKYQLQNR